MEEIEKAYEIGKKVAEEWVTHAYKKSNGEYSPAINEIKDWWIYKFENEITQALAEQRAEIVKMLDEYVEDFKSVYKEFPPHEAVIIVKNRIIASITEGTYEERK